MADLEGVASKSASSEVAVTKDVVSDIRAVEIVELEVDFGNGGFGGQGIRQRKVGGCDGGSREYRTEESICTSIFKCVLVSL